MSDANIKVIEISKFLYLLTKINLLPAMTNHSKVFMNVCDTSIQGRTHKLVMSAEGSDTELNYYCKSFNARYILSEKKLFTIVFSTYFL